MTDTLIAANLDDNSVELQNQLDLFLLWVGSYQSFEAQFKAVTQ